MLPPNELRERLTACGVVYTHHAIWEGEPPNRNPVKQEEITNVFISITPEEWCQMCQAEGEEYMGRCCSNMSYLQDCINSVFREGIFSAGNLQAIAEMNIRHSNDGFKEEDWPEVLLEEMLSKWEAQQHNSGKMLRPWLKIGLVWLATKDVLRPEGWERLHPQEINGHRNDFLILRNTLGTLSWTDLFSPSEDDLPQHEANRQLMLARLSGPLELVMEQVVRERKDFEGWALVDPKNLEPLENLGGTTIYITKEAAEEAAGFWGRNQESPEFLLRPVRVTNEKGLEVLE